MHAMCLDWCSCDFCLNLENVTVDDAMWRPSVCMCSLRTCVWTNITPHYIWCPVCINPRCNTLITRELKREQEERWEKGRCRSNLRENMEKELETVGDEWRKKERDELISLPCPAWIIMFRSLDKPPFVFWEHSQCFALGCMTVDCLVAHSYCT